MTHVPTYNQVPSLFHISLPHVVVLIRSIHGSVQVGFVPNSKPTRLDWMAKISTRHRPKWLIGSGRSHLQRMAVGLVEVGDLKIGQNLPVNGEMGKKLVIFLPNFHWVITRLGEISPDSVRSRQI